MYDMFLIVIIGAILIVAVLVVLGIIDFNTTSWSPLLSALGSLVGVFLGYTLSKRDEHLKNQTQTELELKSTLNLVSSQLHHNERQLNKIEDYLKNEPRDNWEERIILLRNCESIVSGLSTSGYEIIRPSLFKLPDIITGRLIQNIENVFQGTIRLKNYPFAGVFEAQKLTSNATGVKYIESKTKDILDNFSEFVSDTRRALSKTHKDVKGILEKEFGVNDNQ